MRKLLLILTASAVLMFGFGFALVPLYNVFCKVTGLNGKTGDATAYNPDMLIDKSRTVTVQFVASNNDSAKLPWDFYPQQTSIKLHPGEVVRIAYFAKNNAKRTMSVQAIPSVAPGLAATYLKKTECFCFTQQTFKPGESQEMPILFHLDKDLPKHIKTVTLSYTLFDATHVKSQNSKKQGKIS